VSSRSGDGAGTLLEEVVDCNEVDVVMVDLWSRVVGRRLDWFLAMGGCCCGCLFVVVALVMKR